MQQRLWPGISCVMVRTARTARRSRRVLALLLLAPGCNQPGVTIAPPATFVLAWNGPGGEILTMESSNGTVWDRRTAHATTNARDFGPALAHDGARTWMLAWADGPEVRFTLGVGGRPSADTSGIIWSTPTTGVLPVFPASSPAIAFANDRWLAVWLANGRIRRARSAPRSTTSWDSAGDVLHGSAIAPSAQAPALTSMTLNGQRQYVLVYNHATMGAVSATSIDGVNWSAPVAIAATQKDPALAELNGSLYVVLSRQVGIGYRNFVYRSTDGVTWREIASALRAPVNAAGPGLAVSPWKLLITEQIGGALGGIFNGISQRAGTPGSPSANPPGYRIAENDRPVTAPGSSTPETVGTVLARTALLFAEPAGQAIGVTDIALTQSGIVDTLPANRMLVAGKTTMVRLSLRARRSGQPAQIDSARVDVIDPASGQVITTAPGVAFAADNTSQSRTIPDSADAHFFLRGPDLRNAGNVRFDVTLASGNTRRVIVGALEDFEYAPNKGVPLLVTGFDSFPPNSAMLATELMHLARVFPVADSIGPPGGNAGVRFDYQRNIALPVQNSLGSYVDEFVLLNVSLGVTRGPSGQLCAADAVLAALPGRSLAFNFTVEEDLNGDGTLSPAELANCAGPLGSRAVERRFNNFISRLRSETMQRASASGGSDPPEFGAAVFTFGALNNTTAQSRTNGGQIGGQCPQGLAADRFCWAAIGANFPALAHELSHSMGNCHADDPNCPTASQPFPATSFGYDLIAQTRVPGPQRLMTGNVPNTLNGSFLTPAEYELIRNALLSPVYLAGVPGGSARLAMRGGIGSPGHGARRRQ